MWTCKCEDYVGDYSLLCDEHSPDVMFITDGEFLGRVKKGLEEKRLKDKDGFADGLE